MGVRNPRIEWEEQHALEVLSREFDRHESVLQLFLAICKSYKEEEYPRILKLANQRIALVEQRLSEPPTNAERWFKEHVNSDGTPKDPVEGTIEE